MRHIKDFWLSSVVFTIIVFLEGIVLFLGKIIFITPQNIVTNKEKIAKIIKNAFVNLTEL